MWCTASLSRAEGSKCYIWHKANIYYNTVYSTSRLKCKYEICLHRIYHKIERTWNTIDFDSYVNVRFGRFLKRHNLDMQIVAPNNVHVWHPYLHFNIKLQIMIFNVHIYKACLFIFEIVHFLIWYNLSLLCHTKRNYGSLENVDKYQPHSV